MLKTTLLHPEILSALAASGHGAKVLIADGNYPFSTGAPAGARRVYLNFSPGKLAVVEVLQVLAEVIPVEKSVVMVPPDGSVPDIHREFETILGPSLTLTKLKRTEFYDDAKSPDTCLVIATGETRRFANILLTIGVVKHHSE
jgi:L-fucose mutarotase